MAEFRPVTRQDPDTILVICNHENPVHAGM